MGEPLPTVLHTDPNSSGSENGSMDSRFGGYDVSRNVRRIADSRRACRRCHDGYAVTTSLLTVDMPPVTTKELCV